MPTYSYECQKCGSVTDVFHAMSASPKVKCANCGSARTKRLLGTGAGLIFKGSGFYETDYKGKKDSSGAKTKGEATPAAQTDAKPADTTSKSKKGGSTEAA
ncbi:MAG TPA: zinc ribbon domain-containing protein [Candidatus Hydrogenedentes bacterium]|nr:zinc ribbon domain-containing protein [Candidatus Hydrogenedentota bacterium]HOS02579.1 zinc ribbon domain-containing protein [Candidatus Hydrogenedentota bacterium]